MKVLNKITPYSAKRAIPVFVMAVATMFGSCHKDAPPTPTRDVELEFWPGDVSLVKPDAIKKLLNSKDAATIRTIYLVSRGNYWTPFPASSVVAMREFFEPVFELSPKIEGKGNMHISPGEAAKVPEDSLWFVEHGWTINNHFLENNQVQR